MHNSLRRSLKNCAVSTLDAFGKHSVLSNTDRWMERRLVSQSRDVLKPIPDPFEEHERHMCRFQAILLEETPVHIPVVLSQEGLNDVWQSSLPLREPNNHLIVAITALLQLQHDAEILRHPRALPKMPCSAALRPAATKHALRPTISTIRARNLRLARAENDPALMLPKQPSPVGSNHGARDVVCHPSIAVGVGTRPPSLRPSLVPIECVDEHASLLEVRARLRIEVPVVDLSDGRASWCFWW
mmetsp:Transcript_21759/g.50050  ORF Transcript_21759/g.50050 Transcript_21759/m.50050 type:complete len:243 (+) Transcript_21759:96-824(+)